MSDWVEDSINNTGFTQNNEEVVNPIPSQWTTDSSSSDLSIVLSNNWSIHGDDDMLDLTFKYGPNIHFSVNDNGTIGLKTLTELPNDADIGSLAQMGGKLYINEG